jgi:uncharacterized delta-60 repeat protein
MHWPPFPNKVHSSPSASAVIETKTSPRRKTFPAALAWFVVLQAFACLLVTETRGQPPGRVEPTFRASASLGLVGKVSVAALQPDGKVIVGGSFSRGIVRLNADSTLDTSFDADTDTDGFRNTVWSIAVQPDGKILLGGDFTSVNGATRHGLARLNADGTLDISFNPPTAGSVYGIAVQPNGKIVIGGRFSSTDAVGIARLLPDGSLDKDFNATLDDFGSAVISVTLQTDGRILIGGTFHSINGGYNSPFLARLNSDGSADQHFHPDFILAPDTYVNAVALQHDGKIIVGGNFRGIDGEAHSGIARLYGNGTLDAHFTNTGLDRYYGTIRAVAVQDDNRIIVCGDFAHVNGVARTNIARLNANGTLDLGFTFSPGPDGTVSAVTVQPDQKLIISGGFTQISGTAWNSIARINPDGSLEPTFMPDSAPGTNAAIRKLVVQSDGKIILGGGFTSVNGRIFRELARLNADGSLDTEFRPISGFEPLAVLGGSVRAIATQPDGKVLATGYFSEINGRAHQGLVRLNNDGTVDDTFNVNLDFGSGTIGASGSALAIQTQGRIVIAGYFYRVNEVNRYNIARVDPAGTLDNSFDAGTSTPRICNTLTVQTDGKILFSYPDTISGSGIGRLNFDGSRDTGFNVSLDPGPHNLPKRVLAVAIQADTKIIIGGRLGLVNGVARDNIARLQADGSVDLDFNATILARQDPIYGPIPGTISALAIQADGKIVIGGDFTIVNGVPHTDIARLNSDGSLDSTFNVSLSGFNEDIGENGPLPGVTAIEVQNDGKIILGGGFTIVNGVVRNYVARLNSDGSVDRSFNPGVGVRR